MDELKRAFYEVMYKYGKSFGAAGVQANLDAWAENKAGLLALLRRHPQWVEAEKAVVLRFTEGRNIDRSILDEVTYAMLELADGLPQQERDNFTASLRAATSACSATLSEAALATIRRRSGISCVTGQKTSRIIGKLCRRYGVDKHPRYNTVFAQIADAVNPVQILRTAVLSVHPCDFLEMSNRDDTWRSCHTIDRGGYQMGTLSYLADGVSMIFFTVDSDVTDHFYRAPRRTRQMFFFLDNLLFQSRLYPDDASEPMEQHRDIVQRILAQCLGVPNLWTLKKERKELNDYITTEPGSMQYPDYSYCGNLSILKGATPSQIISVGHVPLCVCCGGPIRKRTASLKCDCPETVVCRECGQTVDRENTKYVDGAFLCQRCLHLCAVCGQRIQGTGYPAYNRHGMLVAVCYSCHSAALSACAGCSVLSVCRILGSECCTRRPVVTATGGAA